MAKFKLNIFHILGAIFIIYILFWNQEPRGTLPSFEKCNIPVPTVSGNNIYIPICIKNTGTIAGGGLVEIQPYRLGSYSGLVGVQDTCNPSVPANVHQKFYLEPTEQISFTLISSVDATGEYEIHVLSYNDCCVTNPNCYAIPPYSLSPDYEYILPQTVNVITTPTVGFCGDSICQISRGENINTCSQDCDSSTDFCGDGYCNLATEEDTWCELDCDNVVYTCEETDNVRDYTTKGRTTKGVQDVTDICLTDGITLRESYCLNNEIQQVDANCKTEAGLINGACNEGACITSGGACTEQWTCTAWEPAICPSTRTQSHTCTDKNNCGTTVLKPALTRTCTPGTSGNIEADFIEPGYALEPDAFEPGRIVAITVGMGNNDKANQHTTNIELGLYDISEPYGAQLKSQNWPLLQSFVGTPKIVENCKPEEKNIQTYSVTLSPGALDEELVFKIKVPDKEGDYILMAGSYDKCCIDDTTCNKATDGLRNVFTQLVEVKKGSALEKEDCYQGIDKDQDGELPSTDEDCAGIGKKPYILRDDFETYTMEIVEDDFRKLVGSYSKSLLSTLDALYPLYENENYPVCKYTSECPTESTCIIASSSDRASTDKQLVYTILEEFVDKNSNLIDELFTKLVTGVYEEQYGLCVEKKVDPFKQVMDWINENPILAAGIGIGIFVLIIVLMSPPKSGYRRK